MDDIRIYTGI